MIRDYIDGKRVHYFKPFQSLFVLAALYIMFVQLIDPEALKNRDKEYKETPTYEQLIDNIPEGAYQEKMKPIIRVPEGTYYAAVEGSRGEFGVFLESHGDKTPYRLHFRSTGLPLVSTVDTICRGAKIADLIAIGGTLDYVVPDIDR